MNNILALLMRLIWLNSRFHGYAKGGKRLRCDLGSTIAAFADREETHMAAGRTSKFENKGSTHVP